MGIATTLGDLLDQASAKIANHPERILTIKARDWGRIKAHIARTTTSLRSAAEKLKSNRALIEEQQAKIESQTERIAVLCDMLRANIREVK